MDINNFQRIGALSNAHAGDEFEAAAQNFFAQQGVILNRNFPVSVGAADIKKQRKFDLGSSEPPILVECKSHTWTKGNNSPSAKITTWNEAMYYFHIAPERFRKVFFVLMSVRNGISLAAHYLKNYRHLVPRGVEIWEYDAVAQSAERVF